MVKDFFHIPHQLLFWLVKHTENFFPTPSDLLSLSLQEVAFHLKKTSKLRHGTVKAPPISSHLHNVIYVVPVALRMSQHTRDEVLISKATEWGQHIREIKFETDVVIVTLIYISFNCTYQLKNKASQHLTS